MVEHRGARLVEPGNRGAVGRRVGRPVDGTRQHGHHPILAAEPDVGLQQFGQHRRGHVRVQVGRNHPGRERALNLRA